MIIDIQRQTQQRCKVVFMGAVSVGKSSVLLRYTQNRFFPYQTSSTGASFQTKDVQIGGDTISMQLWDTAGQERFQELTRLYYGDAAGVVIVFDVTEDRTLTKARELYDQVRLENSSAVVLILGNKTDLIVDPSQLAETEHAFHKKFQDCDVLTGLVSAKSGTNVDSSMQRLMNSMQFDRPTNMSVTHRRPKGCFALCKANNYHDEKDISTITNLYV